MKKRGWVWCWLSLLAAMPGGAAAAPLPVFVSILPQRQLVQEIGQDRVEVQVLVPPGADPHTYEPRPSQMAALTKARLFFSVGVPFERVWLPKFADLNPGLVIVPCDRGIPKNTMLPHDHNRQEPNRQAGENDPHIWLSPPLLKIMADNVRSGLAQADPAHANEYERHHAALIHRLDQLDQRLRSLLAGAPGKRFMVFHPSWGYFAQTYGLIQVPIETEGKEPKAAQLQQLILLARAEDIHLILVQPQFSMRSPRIVADATGSRLITADPLAADVPDQLLRVAEAIKSQTAGPKP